MDAFRDLVRELRTAQREYRGNPSMATLENRERLERLVDEDLRRDEFGAGLFDEAAEGEARTEAMRGVGP